MFHRIKKSFYNIEFDLFFTVFCSLLILLVYSITRQLWLSNLELEMYAMASSWTYLQILGETLAIFIIGPTIYFLTNVKTDGQKLSKTIISFLLGIGVALFYFILVAAFSPYIVNQMIGLNPGVSSQELYSYLFISAFGIIFKIFISILIANILVNKNFALIMLTMITQLLLYLTVDLLFLSPFSIVAPRLLTISIANVISPMIIFLTLLSIFVISNRKNFKEVNIKNEIKSDEFKVFIKIGIFLIIESIIRNLFYIFITLEIASGITQNEWAAWNVSMYILFGIYSIFLTSITSTSLHMYSNENEENKNVLRSMVILTTLSSLCILILMPIMSTYFIPWNLSGLPNDVLMLAQKSHYILTPFYVLILFINSLSIYFVINGQAWKYLAATIGVGLVFNIPMIIAIYTNSLTYTYNLTVWSFNLGIFISLCFSILLYFSNNKYVKKMYSLEN